MAAVHTFSRQHGIWGAKTATFWQQSVTKKKKGAYFLKQINTVLVNI